MSRLGWLRRLPRAVQLELLEAAYAPGGDPAAAALGLMAAEDDTTFDRWCVRLSLAASGACPEVLEAMAEPTTLARASAIAEADLSRDASPHSALVALRWAVRLWPHDRTRARAALATAAARDPSPEVRDRIALEQLALGARPGPHSAAPKTPRDRLVVLRARLSEDGLGRYACAALLDELSETVAAAPELGRAALRIALAHVDRRGEAVSAIELDRTRALRDVVAPEFVLGAPLGASDGRHEPRAQAALRGEVRGPVPPPSDPDHLAALAIDVAARLLGGQLDAARPGIAALARSSHLPPSTWAVLALASGRPGRRATDALARRAAATLARPRWALTPLALAHEGQARRALLVRALHAGEGAATAALRAELEADALALRDRGARPAAIALLQELERALAGDAEARAALADTAPRFFARPSW